MKRYILDKNVFQDARFNADRFFSTREIVFMDYFFLESHYSTAKRNVRSTLQVVRPFVGQIKLLKDTGRIIRLSYRGSHQRQRRFIDQSQSRYTDVLFERVYSNDESVEKVFLSQEANANHFLEERSRDAEVELRNSEQLRDHFTDADLANFRELRPNDETFQKLYQFSWLETIHLCNAKSYTVPDQLAAKGFFVFRFSLAMHLLRLYWVSKGVSASKVTNFDRIRNDITDLTYLVYGSYFDGYITYEEKMKTLWRLFLKTLAFEPKWP